MKRMEIIKSLQLASVFLLLFFVCNCAGVATQFSIFLRRNILLRETMFSLGLLSLTLGFMQAWGLPVEDVVAEPLRADRRDLPTVSSSDVVLKNADEAEQHGTV